MHRSTAIEDGAFLAACRRRPAPHTPIWIMRQAGRYQDWYRAIRAKVDFLTLCRTPELAAEVTVRAARQLGVDAAIVFADILLILEPLGVGFRFEKGEGPRIDQPLRDPSDVNRLAVEIDARASLGFVGEAIALARRDLDVPVIGFAGAPFTLASYLVEGGGSRNHLRAKAFMYRDEGAWHALMERLTDALVRYLRMQVEAGADALQIFDSWVGCLSVQDYRRFVQPHVCRLLDALPRQTPVIHFGTGNPALVGPMAEAGGDVIGVDWRLPLGAAWESAGGPGRIAVMGNLEPAAVLAPREHMEAMAAEVLAEADGRPGHIFNLGHGIMPEADVDQVRRLVDFVHEHSAR